MSGQKRLERLLRQYENCKITKAELRRLIETGVLKGTTGIIGPFVIRYQNGKLVISERAFYYNNSTSRASVEGRNNFAKKVQFAQLLNNIDEVKQIWAKADLEGRFAWNRLIKYNDIRGEHPTAANSITPAGNQIIINNLCSLTEDFKLKTNSELNKTDNLIVVISAYDPKNEADNSFEIFRVEGNDLSAEQIKICRKYKKYIIYSAVISGDEWSNTVAECGDFVVKEEEHQKYWLIFLQKDLTTEAAEFTEKIQKLQRKIIPVLRL